MSRDKRVVMELLKELVMTEGGDSGVAGVANGIVGVADGLVGVAWILL